MEKTHDVTDYVGLSQQRQWTYLCFRQCTLNPPSIKFFLNGTGSRYIWLYVYFDVVCRLILFDTAVDNSIKKLSVVMPCCRVTSFERLSGCVQDTQPLLSQSQCNRRMEKLNWCDVIMKICVIEEVGKFRNA